MTDTLTFMDHVEAIRELRARGYVVVAHFDLKRKKKLRVVG